MRRKESKGVVQLILELKEKRMSTLKISKHSDVPTALDLVKEEVDKELLRPEDQSCRGEGMMAWITAA